MRLITAEQIASLLNVKPRTVKDRYINRPDFPRPYRVSKRVIRWDENEVISFVKSCR